MSSHEQEIYVTTSLDENCTEFDFQTDRNYYIDLRQTYLASKLKFVKGRGYEIYNSREVEQEHKEETKVIVGTEKEQQVPAPLVTRVKNILNAIFSNVEIYINNQQIHSLNVLYAHKSYISNNYKGETSEYKGVLHCEGYDNEKFPDEIMEAPSSEPFLTRRLK